MAKMPRYIEESEAIVVLNDYYHHRTQVQHKALQDAFSRVPTADVQEVKHGKWINDKGLYKCSACNELWTVGWASCIPIKQMYKEVRYCPHCGAKMEGDEDADNSQI